MKPNPPEHTRFWGSRYAVGLLVLGGVAGYFLLTEHLAHTLSVLPYLLLLACPLMHVFMHHGHGHDSHHQHGQQDDATPKQSSVPTTPQSERTQ